jgi:hypothetical protein
MRADHPLEVYRIGEHAGFRFKIAIVESTAAG